MNALELAQQKITQAREAARVADAAVKQAEHEYEIAFNEVEGMPQIDGWYLDSEGLISRRLNGKWDDGWGNGGPGYQQPSPPMTRMVPDVSQIMVGPLTEEYSWSHSIPMQLMWYANFCDRQEGEEHKLMAKFLRHVSIEYQERVKEAEEEVIGF